MKKIFSCVWVSKDLKQEGKIRYLGLSTTIDTDVFQYPDSGKFGVVAGCEPGMRPHEAPFGGFFSEDGKIDYWEGE